MKDVIADLDAWEGQRVALATVVDVKRSAPRPPGAKMAINDAGEVSGAVSGGCVEGSVVQVAEEVLGGAPPRLVRYGIEDDEAWSVGLPCGGEIAVWVQADPHPGFAQLARADRRGALVTALDSGERWLLTADGPDVYEVNDVSPNMVKAGQVTPLDEVLGAEKSDFDPKVLAEGGRRGRPPAG